MAWVVKRAKLNFKKGFFWDTLIANHKKESCHEKYNPSRVKEIVPEANLVCAEQVEGLSPQVHIGSKLPKVLFNVLFWGK